MVTFQSPKFLPHHGLPQHHQTGYLNTHICPITCSYTSHNHTSHPNTSHSPKANATRRSLLLLSTALSLPPPPPSFATNNSPVDTTITDRVYLDFSICPTYFRGQAQDQGGPICNESEPMGRVILGLYGKLVPITVSNFKTMCTSPLGSSYKNTLIHKILPGQFMVAGRQGRREKGVVIPRTGLVRNVETISSKAFMLEHDRPGVVSLCLAENDDEDDIKLDPDYHNVEFMITTGPGPCPQLDGKNIIFGVVLEGMDIVRAIASTPTYKPGERIRLFNDFAEFLGDERAQNARTIWNKPLKTVYISDCGELKVAKPSLSPSLP